MHHVSIEPVHDGGARFIANVLSFPDEAMISIAKKAIERKTGPRGLRLILENILLDTMFDLPSMDAVDEVMIDKDVVEGRKDPVRIYAKKAEDAA